MRSTRATLASSAASLTRPSARAVSSGAPNTTVRGSSASTPASSASRAASARSLVSLWAVEIISTPM